MIGNTADTVALGIEDSPPKAVTRTIAVLEEIFGGGPHLSSESLIKTRGMQRMPSIVIDMFPAAATAAEAPKFLPETVTILPVRTAGVTL
jgi:hypothetical protein